MFLCFQKMFCLWDNAMTFIFAVGKSKIKIRYCIWTSMSLWPAEWAQLTRKQSPHNTILLYSFWRSMVYYCIYSFRYFGLLFRIHFYQKFWIHCVVSRSPTRRIEHFEWKFCKYKLCLILSCAIFFYWTFRVPRYSERRKISFLFNIFFHLQREERTQKSKLRTNAVIEILPNEKEAVIGNWQQMITRKLAATRMKYSKLTKQSFKNHDLF